MMPPRIDLPEPGIGLPEMEAIRAESILANGDALQGFDIGPMTANGDRGAVAELAAADCAARSTAAPVGRRTLSPRRTRRLGAASSRAASTGRCASGRAPLRRAPQLIVEWPPEERAAHRCLAAAHRGIGDERLSGRAVRQALAGCGFVHGPLGIFHQPDDHGQAL